MLNNINKKLPLEERIPDSISKTMQVIFTNHLKNTKKDFVKYISTYFAYTVMVEGQNELSKEPLIITDYQTVGQLLKERKMAKVQEEGSLNVQDPFVVVTWEQHFDAFIEQYIEERFTEMLITTNGKIPSQLSKFLTDEDLKDETKAQYVLDRLVTIMTNVYFMSELIKLKKKMNAYKPTDLYSRGEKRAKKLVNEAQNYIGVDAEKDKELVDDLYDVHKLYINVAQMYKKFFNEDLPKGKMSFEVYDKKYKLILLSLQYGKIPIKQVRDLALLPARFEPDVEKAIATLKYV